MTTIPHRPIASPVALARPLIAAFALAPLPGVFAQASEAALRPDATPTRADTAAARPTDVPGDFVVTPNGYFHPSCVHRIAGDERVRGDGTIEHADGTSSRPAPCAYPRYTAQGRAIAPPPSAGASAGGSGVAPDGVQADGYVRGDTLFTGTFDYFNGYVEDAAVILPVSQSAAFMGGQFPVPAAPTRDAGQTIYLFPGLVYYEGEQTILQPVLGWNAFSDSAWTIASWNCCIDGSTNHSDPVAITAGHTVTGTMTGADCNTSTNVCSDWVVKSVDAETQAATTLNTSGYEQKFDWQFAGALEAYGVTQCADFPAGRSVRFANIDITTVAGDVLTDIPWGLNLPSEIVACDYRVSINAPGQHAGDVTLYY